MRTTILGAAGLCGLIAMAPVPAAGQRVPRQQLKLPAQPLGASLRAIASAFGRNVSAPADMIAGHDAPALDGRYSFDEAIAALLAGSGLRAVGAGGGVAITRDAQAEAGASPPDIVVTGTQIRGGASASTVITVRRDDIRNPRIALRSISAISTGSISG